MGHNTTSYTKSETFHDINVIWLTEFCLLRSLSSSRTLYKTSLDHSEFVNLPVVVIEVTGTIEADSGARVAVVLVTGGGVVKSHLRLGVHKGSWVTDPYNPCGSNPEKNTKIIYCCRDWKDIKLGLGLSTITDWLASYKKNSKLNLKYDLKQELCISALMRNTNAIKNRTVSITGQ